MPWTRVQVLPHGAGEHTGFDGAFTLFRFDGDQDVIHTIYTIYTEDLVSGHMTANPDTIREAALRYAGLRAATLSVEDSAELIKRVPEGRYGERTGYARGLANTLWCKGS
ncbi:Scr1 family TA system antitoxin-like transcriptional regulator [Streptomyces sp. NPDC012510]|uniref:Scr1 family TA system antitoxin-like transcriptional regulator n=1 Tax=Streptomyces sp. NPDC012510 TaxID=3364838 RepID=UPI0036E23DAA